MSPWLGPASESGEGAGEVRTIGFCDHCAGAFPTVTRHRSCGTTGGGGLTRVPAAEAESAPGWIAIRRQLRLQAHGGRGSSCCGPVLANRKT